ncbi:MAG: 16S rRNA (uracil(1498)-N(3))-methyltransferase [Chitinophagaceae bacterium]|nr:16S rRNA (uracil(1498)-N(3))-methyltransferase [Chitinophagaceae bacterium]
MNLPCFYEPFDEVDHLTLSEATRHHMLQVLRMNNGEEFMILNGSGMQVRCVLSNVSKRNCEFRLLDSHQLPQPTHSLHMAVSFTKNPARMEWFLEKATEIGIRSITPLISKRSEKHHFKKERFEKILISAMLQSQQGYLPRLNEATNFESVIRQAADHRWMAHCITDLPRVPFPAVYEQGAPVQGDAMILIGPEGDFTAEEVQQAEAMGFQSISLGQSRLRTETAALVACTVYNSFFM